MFPPRPWTECRRAGIAGEVLGAVLGGRPPDSGTLWSNSCGPEERISFVASRCWVPRVQDLGSSPWVRWQPLVHMEPRQAVVSRRLFRGPTRGKYARGICMACASSEIVGSNISQDPGQTSTRLAVSDL